MNTIERRFKNLTKSKTFNNLIELFRLNEKAVLDVGCGYGEFLIHFGPKSVGITITKDEVRYGKENSLDIRYGNIESSDFSLSERFDVVFANNIFEHLFSPHYFLYKARDLLKKDGLLILGVPCIPKVTFLLRINKFRGSLHSHHINFFTRDTLVKTVERGGFFVRDVRGFHFKNKPMDKLLSPVYPHFYVIAVPDPSFQYPDQRMGGLIEKIHCTFE